MGVIIIVFWPRDFINVGAVLKVKSTLGCRDNGKENGNYKDSRDSRGI